MADSQQNSENTTNIDPTLNPASIYFLHPTDVGLRLIVDPFNGSGYADWRRGLLLALTAKNKVDFIDGTVTKPSIETAEYKAWDRVNNTIIGWILTSLEKSISKTFLWVKSARELWVEIANRYGQSSCSRFFSLQEE
ncbi:unnamed protein product [Amaranthus hypochondriacus]